jgi:hypothetical protein
MDPGVRQDDVEGHFSKKSFVTLAKARAHREVVEVSATPVPLTCLLP